MAKMTKNQLIDAVSETSAVSKNDVKIVMEHLATVGYKELNESGEFCNSWIRQNVGGQ
jgi:nucleoid DNA-binding protein